MNNIDSFSGEQPRQDLTKQEIENMYKSHFHPTATDAWYADNVRWGCSFYNINRKVKDYNQASVRTNFDDGEASRGIRNFLYFQGDQQNVDFGWLTQISGGGETIAPWHPGKEINRFVKHIANKYLSIAKNSKPVLKSYDYKALSKMKKEINLSLVRYDFKPFFDEIAASTGLEFRPPGYSEIASKQSIEKFFYQNPTTTAEIYGTDLLNTIRDKNNYVTTSFRSFIDVVCGGRGMIECLKSKGWPKWDVIPYWCQISQGIEDNDFGINDQVKGWIRSFTPSEIVTREGLNGETWGEQIARKYGRVELDRLVSGNSDYYLTNTPNYGGWNFSWMSIDTSSGRMKTCNVARIYWLSLVDTRMLPHNEDPNNKVFFLSDKHKKKGKFALVYRTATLINNAYVVDEGVCDEIRDPKDMSRLFCPIHTFQPYTFLGYSNSIVETVRTIQDDMSMLDYKFREMVGFDMGIILSVLGAKVEAGADAFTILEEIKKTRILTETQTNDFDNPIDNRPLITPVNFSTIEQSVKYIQAWKMKEQQLKDTLNISDVALGTQKTYIGFDTQQASIDASSNNLQYHFFGHAQMMNNVLQYSLEQMKVMIQSGETDAGDMIIGERGVFFIKQMKKLSFGSFLCRTDIDDFVDEARKKTLLGDLRILMQTGQVDLLDLMKIEKMETWGEIMSYVEWKYESKKAEAEGQVLFDKLIGTINNNRNAQAQENIAAVQSDTAMAINQANNDVKLAGDLLKHDAAISKDPQQASLRQDFNQQNSSLPMASRPTSSEQVRV